MVWRLILPLVLVYALFEGFLTNMLYPARFPLLIKDITIVFLYFFFAIQEHLGRQVYHLRKQFGINAWLSAMAFFVVGLVQIFNPLSPGLTLGLVGFKVVYYYWPFALVAFVYATDYRDALKLMRVVYYFAILINLFGMYQFFKGPDFLVSQFGAGFSRAVFMAHIEHAAPQLKSFFRVFGTFASTGQFSSFIVVNTMFGFAILFSQIKHRERFIMILGQGLNFVTMLATGSRAGLVYLIFSVGVFFFLCRRARPMILTALLAGSALFMSFKYLGESVVLRFESLSKGEMIHKRTVDTMTGMVAKYMEIYPLGRGLGSASTAARYLDPGEGSDVELIENYPTKLQIETGLPGVILFYLFVFLLIKQWLTVWLRRAPPEHHDSIAALSAYCFVQFTVAGVFFILDHHPTPIFLWTTIGLVARLCEPEELSRQHL